MEQNVIKINGGITINVDVSVKTSYMRKMLFWNHATCNCENGKYLASLTDDSKIICDEVIESYNEEIKIILTNFNQKKVTYKTQSFYVLLAFLSNAITLLIAVSIYCYLIKYQEKKLLPFHDTKLKQFGIDRINWKWLY